MKYTDILVIGGGKMGGIWAKAFHDQGGTIKGIIDIDDSVKELAQSVDSNYYSPSEIDSIEADIWCIAVPTQFHHTYLQKAVKKGIERVIVEKPSTISPKYSRRATEATGIAVDYVELKNNVVKAVFERIQAETFDPTRLIHWRGKTSTHVNPFMRNDLVHDLSEIYGLYDILEYDFSDISPKHTLDIEGWSKEEKPPRESGFEPYYDIYDVSGTMYLTGHNDENITITGAFNEPNQRRYFLWIDDEQEVAYFASTVNREHLTPVSARVTGKSNIEFLAHRCYSGRLTTDEQIGRVLDMTDAEILSKGRGKQLPITEISRDLMEGKVEPCSLSDAIEIEELVYDTYQMSDKHNMYEEEEALLRKKGYFDR